MALPPRSLTISMNIEDSSLMFLICGEALFDLFLEAPDHTGALRFDAHAGGSPFNVAIGLSRLGSPAALMTGVSTDFLGARLVAQLSDEGVDTGYLIRNGRRTTLSVVGLDGAGSPEYSFYGVGSADCSVMQSDLAPLSEAVRALHFGSYSCVVDPAASAFETLASHASDRLVSFDPNVRLNVEPDVAVWRQRVERFASLADLIKISDEDFNLLWPDGDIAVMAAQWLAGRTSLVVQTRGAHPAQAWTLTSALEAPHVPSVNVVDTVGAGDTFQAALLHQLDRHGAVKPGAPGQLGDNQLRSILAYASAAAAVTCARRGADLPRSGDVADFARKETA
jgi:fructokinase